MKYEKLYKIIEQLPFDEKVQICEDQNTSIYVIRPSKLSKRFKDYDVNKNFQIYIKEGKREFKPNHLRVMIDLNLRVRSRKDLKLELLKVFDGIFYGENPEKVIKTIENEKFDHYLNSIKITATLSQLFLIEQEYSYNKESKFEPKTLFYQGWIREFIDSPKEIDNLCMSVCSFRPPTAKYTNKENKKSKKYDDSLTELWYIEE
ncbi:hypothetical protein B0P06_003890 [Clostridium saccharoperbutylacetonicum]|uniref:Uncharacterized protein n=1 Tax=Clostridium saccharoperbutylacetonicum N1-4(HMT) TaxID=931276 RepID=M1MNN6_9CLOT|nr:hypothetical protein [Clostridium saccharoperbutylacetonicum]AGF57803.1 hypothetical protein Cspa_c40460 [Clostridium saccharoperbutylacetonicum N1-4(HMT)]NRT61427.1 hypothetical protein [Clostridium saccharoperbutylacetonicum]NSB24746.1 hypothetical protein [Clostridium saccharoperbutylacetonicum]NSB44119.1 hypothetical protein [Clostridium saccharoperbutylacetonicum]